MKKIISLFLIAMMVLIAVTYSGGGTDAVSAATPGTGGGGGGGGTTGAAPSAPTNLALPTGYVLKATEVKLVWTDNSSSETEYRIERALADSTIWVKTGSVLANVTSFTDKTVKERTGYKYRIYAYNSYGSSKSASNELLVKTAAAVPVVIPPQNIPSTWAVAEIDKAILANLTTDAILSDYIKPITREEFCEIIVKLYEASSGKAAVAADPNPFADTANAQILKAYQLGIVKGTSATTFAPKSSITRQEIAVMLKQELKAFKPELDFSISATTIFADRTKIASWALDSIRYMNQEGIISGTGSENISPTNSTTREQAIALVYRTYIKFGAN